jgi:hypothetical protein
MCRPSDRWQRNLCSSAHTQSLSFRAGTSRPGSSRHSHTCHFPSMRLCKRCYCSHCTPCRRCTRPSLARMLRSWYLPGSWCRRSMSPSTQVLPRSSRCTDASWGCMPSPSGNPPTCCIHKTRPTRTPSPQRTSCCSCYTPQRQFHTPRSHYPARTCSCWDRSSHRCTPARRYTSRCTCRRSYRTPDTSGNP